MSTQNSRSEAGGVSRFAPLALALLAYASVLGMASVSSPPATPQASAEATPSEAIPKDVGGFPRAEGTCDTQRTPSCKGAATKTAAPAEAPSLPDATPSADGEFLNVVGVIPLEGEPFKGEFVVFFDEDIALDAQASGTPLTVTPDLGGGFQVRSNYISFKTGNVKPTIYEIVLSEHLRAKKPRASGAIKRVAPAQRSHRVAGFAFIPERLWFIDQNENGTVLGVLFPTAMNLEALKNGLSVMDPDGNTVACEVGRGTTSETYQLKLPPDVALPVEIRFAAGLSDATGSFQLRADHEFQYPTKAPLRVTRCQWGEFRRDAQQIRLRFSHSVQSGHLEKYLSISTKGTNKPVPFELRSRRNSEQFATVHLDTPANVALEICVAKGLPGDELTFLQADYTTSLERRPVPLTLENTWWGWEGRDGAVLNVYLNRNVPLRELREHIEIDPPIDNLRVEARHGRNFRVFGDWDSKTSYELRLAEGMKDGEGIPLGKALARRVKTEEVPAYVGFGYEGKYYFPKRSGASMPLETRNMHKAKLELHRMFPSNIAVALNDMDKNRLGTLVHSWSKKMGEAEIETVNVPDRIAETPFDLDSLFPPGKRGVFCLQARGYDSNGRPWGPNAWKLVLFTELGVLAHWQNDELVLFAHDLFSLEPRGLAKVTLYSVKNQILAQGNTNAQGMLHLGPFDTSLGAPRVVVVEYGEDYTFLELDRRPDAQSAEMAGMPPYNRKAYDAFLYADRELYRPGETVHLRWLVRKNHGDIVPNVPLLVTVVKPNGRDLLSQPTVLSDLGSGGLDVNTEKAYPTGKYTAKLTVPGSDAPIGTYRFSLEEFVPNRIKTAVDVAAEHFVSGQEYEVKVNAQHLFGASAADRRCEAQVYLMREAFKPQDWPGFQFGNDSKFTPDSIQCGEAQTDEKGNAAFRFTYRAPAEVTFPLKAVVYGSVFELGGRAVSNKAERTMFPSNICLGVMAKPATEDGRIEAVAAAIRPDGTPADLDKVTITLEKQVWNYYVRRYYSHHEPNWSESFDPVDSREVEVVDGRAVASFPVGNYGYYRIRVHSDKTPQYSTVSFYSYWGRCEIVSSPEQSLIKLSLDKESYEVGEEARVRIESPFDGQGIVVLQTDRIHRMVPVQITNGVGEVSVWVEEGFFPNVWVEATVIHAVQEDRAQVYPFSSFGMTSLAVTDKRKALQVTLPSLPEEIRPSLPAEITIETRTAAGLPVSAELTLAAVDEGIHNITGYKSPDPYAWLRRPRRPDYRRAHYYDKVAYDFDKPSAPGGMAAEMEKRLAADDQSWIKTVVLWSGVVRTDADGKATVTLDVPEFTGQLRLVAVGCTSNTLGAASQQVFVRRKHMMRTSMPRFLLPGDETECRVVLFNHSDAPCRAKVSWASSGAIKERTGSRELDIPAHGEADCTAAFEAGVAAGQGEIRWEAVITDTAGHEVERLVEVAPLPVRTPAAYQSHHELTVLKPGETSSFRNTKFLDDARAELELTVGASPQLRLQEALKYVVHYPYGCVEQTTSCLMPLYALRSSSILTEDLLDEQLTWENYIESGINRLFAMQTSSGGLAMWPGGVTPYPYGSIYALHFLTLVKRGREFDLPRDSLKALQDYVRDIAKTDLNGSESRPYYPSHRGSRLYQRAYATYVLALDGDLEAIRQIERFDHVVLPRAARFLLAAALARNTNDVARVKLYLSSTPSEPHEVTEPGTTLNSDIRNTAVELLALQQMGSAASGEERMAKVNKLIQWLENHRYGTTQETAFVVTALADFFGTITANIESAGATVQGPQGQDTLTGREVYRGSHTGPDGEFVVANTGQTDLFVDLTTRGVPEKIEWQPVREGIEVTRRFLDADGKPYGEAVFHQGDTYIVKVTLNCDQPVENLAVADLLAAGFEVENPRLDTTVMAGTDLPAAASPSFLEIRDDRVVTAYDGLADDTYHFYYVLRAVTPGVYQHPPIEAECMYDARIRARSVPATVKVE